MVIIKTNITNQVVQYLKTNIENATWKAGDKIPSENQLTQILGVSRASVRVAIQQFIGVGVLESVHGKGTFVVTNNLHVLGGGNNITKEDYRDVGKVLEFRRILETESCYLAAQSTTPELIANLKGYLQQMSKNIGNSEEFVKADMLFHEEISKASRNPLIEKTLHDVFQQTAHNHKQINAIFGYKDGIYYHTIIIKALEEGKAGSARKLMREHLQQAIDRLEIQ